MVYFLIRILDKLFSIKPVYAHCDIPCGIYDPHQMQLAAHTVMRMNQLILKLGEEGEGHEHTHEHMHEHAHQIARYTTVKEEHADICKREIRILWGDYFKPEHVEQYPELHDTIWKALKAASKARQEVSIEASKSLIEITQKIAEIFWKTKGVEPVKGKSFYPTEEEIVYPRI